MPYVGTYPLNSFLNFLEQFCRPLPNELDHCVVVLLRMQMKRVRLGLFHQSNGRQSFLLCRWSPLVVKKISPRSKLWQSFYHVEKREANWPKFGSEDFNSICIITAKVSIMRMKKNLNSLTIYKSLAIFTGWKT